jgi:hypothetical protein
VEPLPVVEDRIELDKLREHIERASVALRGWNYPHVPARAADLRPIDGGLDAVVNTAHHTERWRFRSSGLFTHRWLGSPDYQGSIDFVDATWRLTEIWELARRLVRDDPTIVTVRVSVRVDGLRDRLVAVDPRFKLPQQHPAVEDTFERQLTVGVSELEADTLTPAARWAQALMHQLGILNVPISSYRYQQDRLLRRDFG